jgi:transcriptional regulator with GAF, ATPase, and Fis domain
VSLIPARGRGVTPAFTGDLALDADEWQYENEGGPCVEAAQGGGVVRVDDMTTEERWPGYIPKARRAGVGSSLSVPLPVQEAVNGALNLYSRDPHAFGQEDEELALAFAGYAAVAVANAQLYESTAALAKQMEEAMASRAVIEQAKGLIMGQRRCTADQAFQILVSASSRSNRKLRDVAAEIVSSAAGGTSSPRKPAPGPPGHVRQGDRGGLNR